MPLRKAARRAVDAVRRAVGVGNVVHSRLESGVGISTRLMEGDWIMRRTAGSGSGRSSVFPARRRGGFVASSELVILLPLLVALVFAVIEFSLLEVGRQRS